MTFVPCFLWIFLGAPYIEYVRGNRHLSAALPAITAAATSSPSSPRHLWFGFVAGIVYAALHAEVTLAAAFR